MDNDRKMASFDQKLAMNHRAKLHPEERFFVERTLGDGALQFKLKPSGFRALMMALDQETKDRDANRRQMHRR